MEISIIITLVDWNWVPRKTSLGVKITKKEIDFCRGCIPSMNGPVGTNARDCHQTENIAARSFKPPFYNPMRQHSLMSFIVDEWGFNDTRTSLSSKTNRLLPRSHLVIHTAHPVLFLFSYSDLLIEGLNWMSPPASVRGTRP